MRRFLAIAAAVLALGACADPPGPGGSGSATVSPSAAGPSRVDLVEAGLREVLGKNVGGALYVRATLCRTEFTSGQERDADPCTAGLTDEERAELAARLSDLTADVTFVDDYEDIPAGQAPIDGAGSIFAWTSDPEGQADGTYHLEAGESCGGLCGHGGLYVVAEVKGRWEVTGPVPGSGQWIS